MEAKRRRAFELKALGKESYASQSAIANLLTHIRTHGIPEASSRASQYRARKEICGIMTPYGRLVQNVTLKTAKGDDINVSMQAPLPFLHYNAEHSESYARMIMDAHKATPSSPAKPWHIIIYQDGVDPSDMGAAHHTRAACAWYWSIGELGMLALSHEEAWGCICTLRKNEYNKIQGAITGLFASLLELFRGTHDVKLCGISCNLPGGQNIHIYADVLVYFGDEPALKEMLDCKGHAGIKCCALCENIVLISSMAKHRFPPPMETIACFDLNNIKFNTNASIKARVARIAHLKGEYDAGRIRKGEFENASGLLGWNYNPAHEKLFGNKLDIKVADCVMYDWAHIYVHGGLCDVEFGLLMKKLASRRYVFFVGWAFQDEHIHICILMYIFICGECARHIYFTFFEV